MSEISDMLYQDCTVTRTTEVLEKPLNRPKKFTVSKNYKCLVSRKSPGYVLQQNPQANIQIQFRAYLEIESDVIKGDLLTCEGIKYRIGLVYKPMNHHIEADLTTVGDEL